jgi:hypothetical protein
MAFFIIDGDLEWVRGDAPPLPQRVYRIDAYCVENLLIHEDPAIQIAIEEAVLSEETARQALGFENWINNTTGLLAELFVWFAALNSVKPAERTVGLGIGMLLTSSRRGTLPMLDGTKVNTLTDEMRQKTEAAVGAKEAKKLSDAIRARIAGLPRQSDAISGKDYLLPLFEYHLWRCTSRKTRRGSLRVRLARHCSLKRFKPVTVAIAGRMRRHKTTGRTKSAKSQGPEPK